MLVAPSSYRDDSKPVAGFLFSAVAVGLKLQSKVARTSVQLAACRISKNPGIALPPTSNNAAVLVTSVNVPFPLLW